MWFSGWIASSWPKRWLIGKFYYNIGPGLTYKLFVMSQIMIVGSASLNLWKHPSSVKLFIYIILHTDLKHSTVRRRKTHLGGGFKYHLTLSNTLLDVYFQSVSCFCEIERFASLATAQLIIITILPYNCRYDLCPSPGGPTTPHWCNSFRSVKAQTQPCADQHKQHSETHSLTCEIFRS